MACLLPHLSGFLTRWLDNAASVWREVDCVVPVPGHFVRGWSLGFHHSLELARLVAGHLGKPLLQPLVRRRGRSQMALSREARLQNAPRLYRLRRRHDNLSGAHVLIIDDVVTTGATAHAVAALLKQAGAARVRMLALARNV